MAIIHLFIKRPIIGLVGVVGLTSFGAIENRIPEKVAGSVCEAEKNINVSSQAVFDFLDDRACILQEKRNIVLSGAKSRQLKRIADEETKRKILKKEKWRRICHLDFFDESSFTKTYNPQGAEIP